MFRVCLSRRFIARHALIGGDWGPENSPHSHNYKLEWEIGAGNVDRHGYVADLVVLETAIDAVMTNFNESFLNELDEFTGVNPSLERFARTIARALLSHIASSGLVENKWSFMAVRLWENDIAWASYECSPSELSGI